MFFCFFLAFLKKVLVTEMMNKMQMRGFFHSVVDSLIIFISLH